MTMITEIPPGHLAGEAELKQIYEDHKTWNDHLAQRIFRVIRAEDLGLVQKIDTLRDAILVDPLCSSRTRLEYPVLEGPGRNGMWERLHLEKYVECYLAVHQPKDGVAKSLYDEQPIQLAEAIPHAPAVAALTWLQKFSPSMEIVVQPAPTKGLSGTELAIVDSSFGLPMKAVLLMMYTQGVAQIKQLQVLRLRKWGTEENCHLISSEKTKALQQTQEIASERERIEKVREQSICEKVSSIHQTTEKTAQIMQARSDDFDTREKMAAEADLRAKKYLADLAAEKEQLEKEKADLVTQLRNLR